MDTTSQGLLRRARDRALESAKAIVGLATPVLTQLAVDTLADLSSSTELGIAAAATAALVWLTPNKPKES